MNKKNTFCRKDIYCICEIQTFRSIYCLMAIVYSKAVKCWLFHIKLFRWLFILWETWNICENMLVKAFNHKISSDFSLIPYYLSLPFIFAITIQYCISNEIYWTVMKFIDSIVRYILFMSDFHINYIIWAAFNYSNNWPKWNSYFSLSLHHQL